MPGKRSYTKGPTRKPSRLTLDGASMFSPLLYRIAMHAVDTPEPKQQKEKKLHFKSVFTDEQVLDMRIKREQLNWSNDEIAKHYGCDSKWLSKVLTYEVRSKLIPARKGKY